MRGYSGRFRRASGTRFWVRLALQMDREMALVHLMRRLQEKAFSILTAQHRAVVFRTSDMLLEETYKLPPLHHGLKIADHHLPSQVQCHHPAQHSDLPRSRLQVRLALLRSSLLHLDNQHGHLNQLVR